MEEKLIRVDRDAVIEWVLALKDRSILVNSEHMIFLCSPADISDFHIADVRVIALPTGTLLKVERIRDDWHQLIPVWERLLSTLAELERLGAPAKKSGRGPKPAYPKPMRLRIALRWKMEAEPAGIKQDDFLRDYGIEERTLRNYVTEAEELGCFDGP